MSRINYRIVIFAITLVGAIVFSMPSFLQTSSGKKISLGLDLQGGLHMLLGVQTDQAVVSKIKSIASSVQYFTDDSSILIEELIIDDYHFSFLLLDSDEQVNIEKMLTDTIGLKFTKDSNLRYKVTIDEIEQQNIKDKAVSQVVETIRNRLDQFGLAEPSVTRQGKSDISIGLPGIKTVEEEQRARELIAKPAKLEMMTIDEKRADQVYTMSKEDVKNYGNVILPSSDNNETKYLLKAIPLLTGSQITDASVAFDQNNQPIINFKLDATGARIFGDFTGKNIGVRLAVVLDNLVYSAPVIRERIGGGSGQISGGFTVNEAGNVAIALRSGALKAPVVMLEKRSVGPSLGADSVKSSILALLAGFLLVVIFMVVYYGYAGIIANIALIANIFIIIAVMAMFGATLTLPGMAGIVLTVGMAVDANVIINERVRELLKKGNSISFSITHGYNNAMSAILDANITTLLVAVILYVYGTGPIKGFAITISIGILASMLTAILGTHGIYHTLMPNIAKAKSLRKWFGIK